MNKFSVLLVLFLTSCATESSLQKGIYKYQAIDTNGKSLATQDMLVTEGATISPMYQMRNAMCINNPKSRVLIKAPDGSIFEDYSCN